MNMEVHTQPQTRMDLNVNIYGAYAGYIELCKINIGGFSPSKLANLLKLVDELKAKVDDLS